jgi:hypothetical protein
MQPSLDLHATVSKVLANELATVGEPAPSAPPAPPPTPNWELMSVRP